MSRICCLLSVLSLLPGCIVVPIGKLFETPPLREEVLVRGDGFFRQDKLVVVEIDGAITAAPTSGFLGGGGDTVAQVRARLARAKADPEVKGILLMISSPGGEVTASDVIHREILRFRETTELPVLSLIGDTGTSGAYYIAVASDRVLAHPTSIVGSIGVILHSFNVAGLMRNLGVVVDPVKSSPSKDINSFFRESTEDERAVLQKVVDELYSRFVEVVDSGRPDLAADRVRELADGRIVSGLEAKRLGLVDGVGYAADALKELKTMAGIDRPTVVRYAREGRGRASVFSSLSGPDATAPTHSSLELRWPLASSRPTFYYLWQPGI